MSVFPAHAQPMGFASTDHGLGLGDEAELVQMTALGQVFANLESAIEAQEAMWAVRDQDFCTKMGRSYAPTTITRVDPSNFYTGTRPSLIEAPVERWPSITVRCNNARPCSEQLDQIDIFDLDLFIEILCFVGPYDPSELGSSTSTGASQSRDPEDDLDKQVQRLTAAAHLCIRSDPTLGGVITPLKKPPKIIPSLPWIRDGAQGDPAGTYAFQGKQLSYDVTKYSV